MRWLQSGLRRDICVIVAGLDDPTGQQTKAALERHYDDRVQPKTFHGALDALVEGGFLSRTRSGLADTYALTDAGRRRLHDHYAWIGENIDVDVDGNGDGDETGNADAESPNEGSSAEE